MKCKTLKLVHFSPKPDLDVIDPAFMGSSINAGAEMANQCFRDFKNHGQLCLFPGYKFKSNWYIDKSEGTIESHRFSANYAYVTSVDSCELLPAEERKGRSDKQIFADGYRGLLYKSKGQVRMFDQVPVKKLGKAIFPKWVFNKINGRNWKEYLQQ